MSDARYFFSNMPGLKLHVGNDDWYAFSRGGMCHDAKGNLGISKPEHIESAIGHSAFGGLFWEVTKEGVPIDKVTGKPAPVDAENLVEIALSDGTKRVLTKAQLAAIIEAVDEPSMPTVMLAATKDMRTVAADPTGADFAKLLKVKGVSVNDAVAISGASKQSLANWLARPDKPLTEMAREAYEAVSAAGVVA